MAEAWKIVGGPSPDDGLRIDSSNWIWDIEKDGDHRRVVVEVTNQSTLPGAIPPDETKRALETQGRSVVEAILLLDSPPRRVTCTTRGCYLVADLIWQIVGGPRTINLEGYGSDDVSAGWVWEIERGDEARSIRVYVSHTAAVANDTVEETKRALATQGRSVVQELLGHEGPPERVTCSTHGWSWDGLFDA